MALLLDLALGLLVCLADAAAAVLRWGRLNGELSAGVEPRRDQMEAR